jgi:UDP-N-acetylglucosamine 2-epimerase (non-hydrolysing)
MNKSYIILTDSGGIQEEAPSLGKPVLVMRNNTERPEGVKTGTTILVGTETKQIVKKTNDLLANKELYDSIRQIKNPYGDGEASIKILNFIKSESNIK